MNFIMEAFSGHDPFAPFLLLLLGLAALVGTWKGLTRWRHAKFYPIAWTAAVLLLTGCWGSALINAIRVGNGTLGNGWDAFGAAVIFLLSLPTLVWDIVFLLRWTNGRSKSKK